MRAFPLRLPAGPALGEIASPELAATLFIGEAHDPARPLWVALPGGGMSRGYYDLPVPGDASFSCAAALVAAGQAVLAIDPPGVGDSSRPADSYGLTLPVILAALDAALQAARSGLAAGTLVPGLPAWPGLRTLGLGHSMGAMLTTAWQGLQAPHAGIALLGFSTRGLPDYVPAELHDWPARREALAASLPARARGLFQTDYPVMRSNPQSAGIYGGESAEPVAVTAVKQVRVGLLPVPAFQSMLPGNVAAEAEAVRVPVFLGLGERDMAGPTHAIPAQFPASGDVQLHRLPGAGHSHFLFPARSGLFRRLAHWARGV